jgi:hypothetical protein
MAVTTSQREALRARHGTHFHLQRWGFTRRGDCRKANWRAFGRDGHQVVGCGYTLNELKSHLRLRFGRDIAFTTSVLW